MIVGLLVSSTVTGRIISRTGRYRRYMIAGAATLTVGLALMGTIRYDTSFVLVSLYLAVLGAGVGMLMQNLVLATQNTLDVREMGSGTATVAFFRTLGGAVGVSALGAVLAARITTLLIEGLAEIGIDPAALGADTTAVPDVSTLPAPVRTVVEAAFGEAIADLFLIAVPLGVVTLVAVLLLREVPLGTRSGIEQRLADDALAGEGSTAQAAPEPGSRT
jgi:MFS family permease